MQSVAGFAALFLAIFLTGCGEGVEPAVEPEPYRALSTEYAVTLDGPCEEFVTAHPPTKTFRLTAEVLLPSSFRPDSGDYLILKLYGNVRDSAEDLACVYYAEIAYTDGIPRNDAGTLVSITVVAGLDESLENYLVLEGYRNKQAEPEYGAFRIDKPPMAFDPKRSRYRFEGLAVRDANIRVRNATGMQIDSVQIGEQMYGPMGIDETSRYRPFGVAYRYNYVKLYSGPKVYVLQPIDYVGEQPIGNGFFTYELYMSGFGNLAIGFNRD